MAIDYDKLLAYPIPETEHELTARDSMLYALGIGLGADPVDAGQLQFVYEEGLKAVPSMAVVLCHPGFWVRRPDTGIDWVRVLHGEQSMVLHRPLPTSGKLVGQSRVTEIYDKGADKGALMYQERVVRDAATGEQICTLTASTFCRGDGGFGGPSGPSPRPHQLPDRAPDGQVDLPTLPQAALVYRLSGDYNPLHADPAVAKAAGFDRPILHGLCTFGVACHALIKALCNYQPERLVRQDVRFSAPVYPGETIRLEYWRDGATASFRAKALERDVVVLNNGYAELV